MEIAVIALLLILLIARQVILRRLSANLPGPDPSRRSQKRKLLLILAALSIAAVGLLILLPEQFYWVGLAILLPSLVCLAILSGDHQQNPLPPDPVLRRPMMILLGIKITLIIVILAVSCMLPSRSQSLVVVLLVLNFVCWSTATAYVAPKERRRKTAGPLPKPET